jgi:DNA replication protein DnaD
MTGRDKNLKKVYDATLAMISRLHFKQASLSQEEMYFLLSLLDRIMQGKAEAEFIDCLRKWQTGNCNEDINEIIKASLLPLDFNDPAAVKETSMLILDLLNYQNDGDNE